MLTFDPTTTSGEALADLFRAWCELRGDDPDGDVNGGDMVDAVADAFLALGLDIGGSASQVDMPAGHSVFTVFGLIRDRSDDLYVAGVIPGEHAEAVVELESSDDSFGRYTATFVAKSAEAAADLARGRVEEGDPA
ncbi:hypothetical protein OG723_44480 (plasmid) [Streptomyces sp. NBC_01278]|uniref:hypothetical protein n=1 Tax=Streptomyces sp. NBC_01278 TaxID=2903809 RepID=UPI002E340A5D|nr:hypothetical protein [Streptomyces sp. NBC_01278]